MTVAVIAEKPSVARDIARVIGASKAGDGYLHGNGWVVSWAIGHLVRLSEPQEMDPAWRRWLREPLPMLPEHWPLVIAEATREHYAVVRRILTSPKVERVVCATDAGREGEYIFRLIYEVAGCTKPISRLWISSLTREAISAGFSSLRDGAELDDLADAARGRSRADWLVGMNMSRALTLAHSRGRDDLLTVGRVQTPTLAMVASREVEIREFKPEDYLEVVADFKTSAGGYRGVYFAGGKDSRRSRRLPPDSGAASAIVERVLGGSSEIESLNAKAKRILPPLLYDLTELQRHANRLYGFSAKKTLGVAQSLYERAKLISYPRTDSRHLSRDVAATLPEIVEAIREPYEDKLAPGTGKKTLGRRFVNDAKVSDHHAIIPTTTRASTRKLGSDEELIYDLLCRRLLSAWQGAHRQEITRVVTAVTSADTVDRFSSRGTVVVEPGWKVLDVVLDQPRKTGNGSEENEDQDLPATLEKGLPVTVTAAKSVSKKTRPPKRFTEATLLTAMETAGKTLDDRELEAAMKGSGLGTPATRAEIIETLLRRGYMKRQKKALVATETGIRLIDVVHPWLKSPAMTGEWESRLTGIERGEGDLQSFIADIEEHVRQLVGETFGSRDEDELPAVPSPEGPPEELMTPPADGPPEILWTADEDEGAPVPSQVSSREPTSSAPPSRDPQELLHNTFGHDGFRPYQEEVCTAVIGGEDVLLVMPTGAGKSLCYQLPGLARGGTTVVVSPLIALMEDQVAKLQAIGLRAERIHSGLPPGAAAVVKRAYAEGMLDYLFIAPERLAVPGFPELLARTRPVLVAIDEAHCISHWGHDFRPEYRMLGERLPELRPTPVIALTATATPLVQADIAEQLGIAGGQRFIRGFRRSNLALEVVEAPPSSRRAMVASLLANEQRRPALVYAPTRKETEALAAELGGGTAAAAYHAGLSASVRSRVQASFLAGERDVVVATIAFGMGVDKADIRTVIHTGLPGTLESYYQEIGRAGRDGEPARAILLYSWADRHTHEFFLKRDYPDPTTLEAIFEALSAEPQPREQLQRSLAMGDEAFLPALEKLWIHGGALVDPEERACRGRAGWRKPYVEQRRHRHAQLEQMVRFAASRGCRMQSLVDHFGDTDDTAGDCGICDHCAPAACIARRFRTASRDELTTAEDVLSALRERDGQTTGQLFRELVGSPASARNSFERVLDALVRTALVESRPDSFVKDGRTIRFQRAWLTLSARSARHSIGDELEIAEEIAASPKKKRRATKKGKAKGATGTTETLTGGQAEHFNALREWRLKEARKRRVPAFHILSDRVLTALVRAKPSDGDELLEVSGIGPTIARKYGKKILEILAKP